MSEFLANISRLVSQHWRRSLLAALGVLGLLVVLAVTAPAPPPDSFDIPGTDSQKALDLLQEHQPSLAGVSATVVFSTTNGKLDTPAREQQIEKTLAKIKQLDGVTAASNPLDPKDPALAPDGQVAISTVEYKVTAGELTKQYGLDLEQAGKIGNGDGVTVSMSGAVIDAAQVQTAPIGELIGIAIAILLLTILFRSGAAMAATLFGALLGVAFGQLLLTFLATPLGLPAFSKTIAIMLGLGAGIDYSLLIIGRYREQIAAGDSVRDAAARAASTAGSAVLAAGLIVMVAIAGLLVIGIPLIGKMGVGAAIGVAMVVVSALTVLPIMIGALAKWLRPKKASHVQASPLFARWGTFVTRKPWLSILLGVSILLALAFPVLDMRLGQPDDGNQPKGSTERTAYDQVSRGFGAGVNGPFLIVATSSSPDKNIEQQLKKLYVALEKAPGVASVSPPDLSADKVIVTASLIPTTSPQNAETTVLLERLRNDVIPKAVAGTNIEVYIGGQTAAFEDFSTKTSDRLPLFIAFVIGLSVLLLMAAFRSLWIPLVSAVFNLLSVGAAYGLIVTVFQKGIGAELIGVEAGVPIISFIPVMIFAILFGLSMDYNVFLLSRVHEAYKEGAKPREAVITGVSRIGKVVLFAGLIMASVFLSFVLHPDIPSKMIGLGLGLAILIDVLIVRLVVAPAVVTLLGDRAWNLPCWLDRIMPDLALEGKLVKRRDPEQEKIFPESS